MLLQYIDGLVGVSFKSGFLQFPVFVEFVVVPILDDLCETSVPERSLRQFRAEVHQDAGIAGRNQREMEFVMMLFPLRRRCGCGISTVGRSREPVVGQHDAFLPVAVAIGD